MLEYQPTNLPAPGTAIVADKGLAGEDFEEFLADDDLGLILSARAAPPLLPKLAA
jgi:hypothetical protein